MNKISQFIKHQTFVKYVLTGMSVTVFELALLYWLVSAQNWWYLYASSASFLFGLTASFFLRKIIVFKNHDWPALPRQLFFYSLVWVIDLVLNAGFMYLLVDGSKLGYIVSQIISNIFLGLFGFFFNQLVTFKKCPEAQAGLQHHRLIEEINKN
jgi:putative flippase GtrA